MKNKILTVGALVAFVTAVLLTGHVLGAFDGQPPEENQTVQDVSISKYTLKAYDGVIAVFLGDNFDTPAAVTGILVEGLRSYDRTLLENGIEVSTYEELLILLEDFGP